MAEGTRQLNVMLTPVRQARLRGGYAALAILLVLAGSALAATLWAGIQADFSTSLEGLAKPAAFTLWQAFLSTVLSLAFAIPVAVALESLEARRLRAAILSMFAVPLSLPAIVAVLAILELFGRSGWLSAISGYFGLVWKPDIYGLSGIILAHVFFNMPLAVRLMASALDAIPSEHWKLAASLKFTFVSRLSLVLWPVLKSAIPGIAGLIFMLCLASYTIILVIGGGPSSQTIQTAIQQALTIDLDIGRAAWLTLLQLGLTFFMVLLLPLVSISATSVGMFQVCRWHVSGPAERLAALTMCLAGCVFVGMPLVAMIVSGLNGDHLRILEETSFRHAVAASAIIGIASAIVSVMLGWYVANARHALQSRSGTGASMLFERLPLILLGLPPLVLGTGWFVLALKLGVVHVIAPLAVIAANALMALPFVLQILTRPLGNHYSATDRLAATMRLDGWQRFRLISLPSLKRPLIQALMLAFVLSLGDLGVVTLFGSDRIQTVPALIYAKMGAYRTNDSAVLAFYLALVTGFLAWLALKEYRDD